METVSMVRGWSNSIRYINQSDKIQLKYMQTNFMFSLKQQYSQMQSLVYIQ